MEATPHFHQDAPPGAPACGRAPKLANWTSKSPCLAHISQTPEEERDSKCKLHCRRQQVGPGCAARGWGDPVTLGALRAPDSGRAAARASAFRPRPDNERFLSVGPGGQTGSGPAPSAGPAAAAHRWFSVREGRRRRRHFYITIELCAPGGNAPLSPSRPPPATPPSGSGAVPPPS